MTTKEKKKKAVTKWTRFMDMHSGGGTKEGNYEDIYIEAPEGEAKVIFYNRFGHSPDRVSCTCCGEDYSIYEVTAPESGKGVLVIYAKDIKPEERKGSIPEQGYVWRD